MSVTLHTDCGDVKVELFCREVPRSAANFLALCAAHRYDNTPFHRVISAFIVQTGDPTGAGTVSRAAFASRLPDDIHAQLTFARAGVVAFANSGRPSSKGVGSQFFITLAAAPHLDATCTIVGRVIHGMHAVRAIAAVQCERNRPITPVLLRSVTIHANPFADGALAYHVR
ncbi:unnamed protein product [Agarophyton chilense]